MSKNKFSFKKIALTQGDVDTSSDEQLAKIFYNRIGEYQKALADLNISSSRKIVLDGKLSLTSAVAIILPIINTIITAAGFFWANTVIPIITNIGDIIPPFFINMLKGKIDNCFKGLLEAEHLTQQKTKIAILIEDGKLKDESAKIVDDLNQIGEKISQLGAA